MKTLRLLYCTIAAIICTNLGWSPSVALADGTEELGTPSIAIATGTSLVEDGTGMITQPGLVQLPIPAGVQIKQVLVYWEGQSFDTGVPDDTIEINGTEVTGTLIGGPLLVGLTTLDTNIFAYRADITNLNLVVAGGANNLTMDGLSFDRRNHGAGVIAIIDDGVGCSEIQIFDGLDFAYWKWPDGDLRQTTVPKTFTFPATSYNRTASLNLFVGSVATNRPNQLDITVGGVTTTYNNVLNDLDGPQWSSLTIPVDIPAGETEMTVHPISPPINVPANLGGAASLTWMTAGFVLPKPGEIGDTVFCDYNRNGVQDPAEPGIPGVTVNLSCELEGGVIATDSAVTDANGHYLFTGLPPGDCTVTVDQSTAPPDCNEIIVNCPLEITVDLAPGQSYLDADFCFGRPPRGQIGDTVYCDLNRNGVQDPGEPGIDGVTVYLICFDDFGTVIAEDSRVTADGGIYLFDDLEPGLCIVAVDQSSLPPDCSEPICEPFFQVQLGEGQSFLDADFCYAPPPLGEIGDTVFCDHNRNGVQDPGDEGLPGVTVDLVCITDQGLVELSMQTDANGNYLFSSLPLGSCVVTVDPATVPPPCNVILPPEICPLSYDVVLSPGALSFLDADFCFGLPGCPLQVDAFCEEVVPDSGPSDDDCQDGDKVKKLTMLYTGEDCSFTNVSQEGKVQCTDFGLLPASAYIVATDKENPNDSKAKIWFSGAVSDGTTYMIDAANAGAAELKADTWVHVFSGPGGSLLQSVKFHTSCSKALATGNQFGANILVEIEFRSGRVVGLPDTDPGARDLREKCIITFQPGVICPDGDDIYALDLIYTAEDCTHMIHSQAADKVDCIDYAPLEDTVFIRVTEKSNPSDLGGKIYFEGIVSKDSVFSATAANANTDKFRSNTFVHVFSEGGSALLQTIKFHTSCSQPLATGNQFGSIVVFGADAKDTGTVGLGAEVKFVYFITNTDPPGGVGIPNVVVSDSFGLVDTIPFLAPGEVVELGRTVTTTEAIMNTVTALGSPQPCEVTDIVMVTVEEPPPPPRLCESAIQAFTVTYTGPDVPGPVTVKFTGSDGASVTYNLAGGLFNGDSLSSAGQNGWTIDSIVSGEVKLGSKTYIEINGVLEVIHTSCSAIFAAPAPAPLDNPKGDPSQLWFVEDFVSKP